MARFAGGVLFAFGIALTVLTIWIIGRQFAGCCSMQSSTTVLVISLFLVSAFCALVGYRLLFNRPNRHGSLLPPFGWKVLAAVFFVLAIAVALIAIAHGQYRLLVAPLGLGVLAYYCLVAGGVRLFGRKPSPVFPPETSLLQMKEFVPAGFRCGIEILNDDRTPMRFVVSMLCKAAGLNETDAIRTMLEIHAKGGVLLAMASMDEARRVADNVTAEARASNHPLVCRAVSLEG